MDKRRISVVLNKKTLGYIEITLIGRGLGKYLVFPIKTPKKIIMLQVPVCNKISYKAEDSFDYSVEVFLDFDYLPKNKKKLIKYLDIKKPEEK